MRKLKLQVQMTVDGFIGGPNGEMDWVLFNWTDDVKQYVIDLTAPVDCIVLGRKLAQGFIPHWANVAANPNNPDFAAGRMFTDTHKVVFTKTLEQSEWPNTVLAKGNLVDEITQLKQQAGKDIIAYGGATFVSALIQHGLIDEFHLFINPTAIGNGLAIFKELAHKQPLTLVKATPFACGIVALNYALKHDEKQHKLIEKQFIQSLSRHALVPLDPARGRAYSTILSPLNVWTISSLGIIRRGMNRSTQAGSS